MTERVRTALVCVPAYLAVFAAGWGITQLDAQKQALEVLLLAAGALVVGMAAGWSIAQVWVRRYLQDGQTRPLWKFGAAAGMALPCVIFLSVIPVSLPLFELTFLSYVMVVAPVCVFSAFFLVFEADPPRVRRGLRALAIGPVLIVGFVVGGLLIGMFSAERVVPVPGELDPLFNWADVRDAVAAVPLDVTPTTDNLGNPVIEYTPATTVWPERVDHVVEAATAVAHLGEHAVTLLGYACIEPGVVELGSDGNVRDAGFWSWDGRPVPRPDGIAPPLVRHGYAYAYEFYLDVDRSLHAARPDLKFTQFRGRRLPGSGGHGTSVRGVDERIDRISINTDALPLFPDEGELCVSVSWGAPVVHTVAAAEGSVVRTASDAIQVLVFRDGYRAFSYRYGRVGSGPLVGRLSMDRQNPRDREGPWTSIVLLVASGQTRRYFDPEAITADGRTLTPNGSGVSGSLYNFQVRCASNEVRAIRFHESPHRTQIRFRLPNLAGAPESPAARRNLLAARIPIFSIRQTWDVEGFVRGVFQRQLDSLAQTSPAFPATALPGPLPEPSTHRNWTVRQILDHYYPHRWHVEDNTLWIDAQPRRTVIGQIRLALDALKRSE